MLPRFSLFKPSFLRNTAVSSKSIYCLSLAFLLLMPQFSLAAIAPQKEAPLPATLTSPYDITPNNSASNNTPEYIVIKPSEQVTYSSETAASVAELNVKEGSLFKTGDILLKLDCRIQSADLDKAIAQASTANFAEKSAEKLKSYGSISALELTKARSDASIARAEVDKLKAIVDKCVIKAPFNGAVAQVMTHLLETVKPGDPLLEIMNTENLEFEIEVPSSWLRWLRVGTKFYVHLNETNQKVAVAVIRIDPDIESVSQTIKITGKIIKPDPSLLPGMSGQAIFPDNPDTQSVVKDGK